MHNLQNKKIAILVTDGFEQVELTEPRKALDAAGAITHIVSPKEGRVKGWQFTDWGDEFEVDVPLDRANPDDYDGLLLPGGQINPDKLRADDKAVGFVRRFFEEHKPVAAICHGPWLLVEAGGSEGPHRDLVPLQYDFWPVRYFALLVAILAARP